MNNDITSNIDPTTRRNALRMVQDLAYGGCDIRTADEMYGTAAITFCLDLGTIREYDEMYYLNR